MPAAEPQFREHTLATDLRGGYQVVAADLNHDGKPDLIALASGMSELLWFENPGWKRHVLATGISRAINLAAWDSQIVFAQAFSMDPKKSAGIVSLLTPAADPRLPWTQKEIDRVPASHRLRWADIEGNGRKVVISAPLAGAAGEPPAYRARVPLLLYRPGAWKRETITDELEGVLHGLWILDWAGDGRDEILTASFEGIHLFHYGGDGRWTRKQLARGSPEPWPKCGSSDVAAGRLGDERFLCAIEPWHGNQVAVYPPSGKRHIIDDTLADGHALLTADLDGDGRDEIVAGCRGGPRSVYIYTAADATHWTRRTLDEGMAAASCAAADLNGDGRPDLACIDGSRLRWYENLGVLH